MLRTIDYVLDELRFAYQYRVYLRWQTHRNRPNQELTRLDANTLGALVTHQSIHVLECESGSQDVRTLVSLQPDDAVAACEGKIKGQAAKWLRERSGERFSRGYFACTSGQSTAEQVDAYLASQGEHHGYADRPRPPVYVATFKANPDEETRLQSPHARTLLRFHVVLATWRRRGVFGADAGTAITRAWRDLEQGSRFALLKVSFVPDHVHLALRVHPVVPPGPLVVALMNAAQVLIWRDFADDAIQARVERLWQPSAYVGSYGDLATPQVGAYLRRWRESHESDGHGRHPVAPNFRRRT